MKHFVFHLMPYPHLPPDFAAHHETAWVWGSNKVFDPEKGHTLYNEYIDQLCAAEPLGFDGVCVNEHHQTVYGLMPSPNIIAAALAVRTKRVKIAVLGNALPFYDPPTRVAEEIAMLDCISGGRIISGHVVGGGPEYFSSSLNPAQARTRFAEAHEIIMRAWTEPGPFEHYGEHYKLRYVNVFPRPLQKPHPPIWIPGVGSLETMQFVAQRRYAYMGIPYFAIELLKRQFKLFRDTCEQEGYRAHPEQLGLLLPIYVGATDAKAREEYEPHFWYFQKNLLSGFTLAPPGYTSPQSALRIFKAIRDGKTFISSVQSWEDVERGGFALVGGPETVAGKLIEWSREVGNGNVLIIFQLGNMPSWRALESMRRYAEEVIPLVNAALPDSTEPLPTPIPFPKRRAT